VASLSGVLWIDENRDGVIDGGEQRLSGITVSLLDAGGAVIRTAATGSVGQYYFSDLPPGTYTVSVSLADLPPGVVQVFDPDGVLDGAFAAQLSAGTNVADVNFGFAQDGSTTTPSTTTTTPGDLPRTGSDIDLMVLLVGFLLALGGLLLLAARGAKRL
jgi:LPXTG-motif cell wall-anchored protein